MLANILYYFERHGGKHTVLYRLEFHVGKLPVLYSCGLHAGKHTVLQQAHHGRQTAHGHSVENASISLCSEVITAK